jgi:hypothetical protein
MYLFTKNKKKIEKVKKKTTEIFRNLWFDVNDKCFLIFAYVFLEC